MRIRNLCYFVFILIGSIVGGLNILSIFGWRKVHDDCKQQNKILKLKISDEDILKVEMRLLDYLEESEGKAFTAKALHKRCIEENHIKISVNQIEKILSDLYSVGKVRFSVKENVRYYLIP